MRRGGILSAAAVLGLAAAALVGQTVTSSASTGLKRIHDPGHVTYSIHLNSCHTRDRGQLPDTSCTPGSIDPAVTQTDIRSTICRSGFTKKVRPPESQTEHAKYSVSYPAYHLSSGTRSELDHLVPLELGGSNDITNLWPEVGSVPNPKDKVENALNHAVCDGKVSLAAAQSAIASDWLTAEARLKISNSTGGHSGGAWCAASASYNSTYRDYDIYVHSNQPDHTVTASASNGKSHSYYTNSSGYADVYLYADPGDSVRVTVGAATCTTTA
jgi:hypothetical protein